MKDQEIFDKISKLNLANIKDGPIKNTFELFSSPVENLHREIIGPKEIVQDLRDENNRPKAGRGKPSIGPSTKPRGKRLFYTGQGRQKEKTHQES